MSLNTEETEIIYTGNGVASTFAIPFQFQNPLYIKAQIYDYTDPADPVIIDLDRDTDFTQSGTTITTVMPDMDINGDPILVPLPVTTAQKLRIFRDTRDTRPTDYNTYQFPYPTVNLEMDRIHQRLQELKREVDSAIKLNALSLEDGETLTGEEILQAIGDLESLIENLDGGSGLPSGGEAGDFLERLDDTTVEWKDGSFTGFSGRFNENFSSDGLHDTLAKILNLQYVGPLISLSASPGQGVREKGTVVSSVTLTANTTKRLEDITAVRFYRNGALIHTDPSPSADGSANSTYVDSTPFSDNMSFSSQVDDGIGPTVTSNTVTYSYVYPYYSGAGAPGLSAASVAGLTKDVRASTANLNKAFTTANGNVYYFAYPASYGALTSIKDENNFETLGDWTLRTESITGLDGTAVSYRIYEFNNPVVAGSTNYTFIR